MNSKGTQTETSEVLFQDLPVGIAVFKLNNQVYLASSHNILMYAYTLLLNDATLAEWRLYDSDLNISVYLYNPFKFDSERGQKSYLAKYFNQNGYVVVR